MSLVQPLSSSSLIAQAQPKVDLNTVAQVPPRQTPTTRPTVTKSPAPTQVTPGSSTTAAKGPAAAKLRQQMEGLAQQGGARSVKELVTVPELNPLYNDKSAALWKTMNQSSYNASGGVYGVSATGKVGSKGTLVNLYGTDNLVARSKQFDAAGVGAYSLLGACAGWNLNGLAGMSLAQRLVQAPLGIVRDMANIGANQLDTSGLGNVWLETGVKGAGGAVITVLSNKVAAAAGQKFAPGQPSWAPGAPMRKGMVVASFSVNISLTALSEMEKLGWLGGKLPAKPTGLEKLTDVLKKGAAVGIGVFVAVGPAVWNATGGSKGKTALTFGLPFLQYVLGSKVTGGLSEQPAARGASSNLIGDGGSRKVKGLNLTDELRNGANPFQLADVNRTAAGAYQNFGEPALKISTAVLGLQDATRPTTTTPNVRNNDEAASVIKRAITLDKAGTLPEPAKKQLRALLSDLKANDVYFGSANVKAAANTASAPNGAAAAAVNPATRTYVRHVFDGTFRNENIKKTDWGSMAGDLVMTGGAFLLPKVFLPAGVAAEILKPTSVANAEINKTTYPGFANRINAKYDDVFAAVGVQAPDTKWPPRLRQDVEYVAMKTLYSAVWQVIRSRPGSETQHGLNNIPPLEGANGGYVFTAFERMTPAEKTAVRLEVSKAYQTTGGPTGPLKPVPDVPPLPVVKPRTVPAVAPLIR